VAVRGALKSIGREGEERADPFEMVCWLASASQEPKHVPGSDVTPAVLQFLPSVPHHVRCVSVDAAARLPVGVKDRTWVTGQ
jgi:hypothetical protein